MHVKIYQANNEWRFHAEHMGREIRGWSLDEQGARHAADKSQEFLEVLAIRGIEFGEVVAGDDCTGTEVGT